MSSDSQLKKIGRPKKLDQAPKETDKEKIIAKLGDFDPKSSEKCKEFMRRFSNPRQPVIKAIMKRIAEVENLTLTREEKKSKKLIMKWIELNWDKIEPHLHEFVVKSEDGQILNST